MTVISSVSVGGRQTRERKTNTVYKAGMLKDRVLKRFGRDPSGRPEDSTRQRRLSTDRSLSFGGTHRAGAGNGRAKEKQGLKATVRLF